MSDEGLECVSISASTRVRLAEEGLPFPGAFCADVSRRDGQVVRMSVATLAHLAELLNELKPKHFSLDVGRDEDAVAIKELLDGLTNRRTKLH